MLKRKKEAGEGLSSNEAVNTIRPKNYLLYTDSVSIIVRKALWIENKINFAERFFDKKELTPADFIGLWNQNYKKYGEMTLDEAEMCLQMTREIGGGRFGVDEKTGRITSVLQPER